MPLSGRRPIGWWSPDPRGVLPLDGLRVSRSLRQSAGATRCAFDHAFDEVVRRLRRPRSRRRLDHRRHPRRLRSASTSWAGPTRVETWDLETGELAGGLYGVAIEGLFAGESMFHRGRDASKVALVGLVERLRAIGAVLLDVQWLTPHLASLGAVEVPRERVPRAARRRRCAPRPARSRPVSSPRPPTAPVTAGAGYRSVIVVTAAPMLGND